MPKLKQRWIEARSYERVRMVEALSRQLNRGDERARWRLVTIAVISSHSLR